MKRLIRISILMFILLIIPNVKGMIYEINVEKWENGIPYLGDQPMKNTWAYDNTRKAYIYINDKSEVERELKDIYNDPSVKYGKLHIKALVPEGVEDFYIFIQIDSGLYSYEITLNKENNYEVTLDAVVENYDLFYFSVPDGFETTTLFPNSLKVYKDQTTNIEMDYKSQLDKYKKKTKKEDKVKKIILIVGISFIVLALLVVLLMFLKARSI